MSFEAPVPPTNVRGILFSYYVNRVIEKGRWGVIKYAGNLALNYKEVYLMLFVFKNKNFTNFFALSLLFLMLFILYTPIYEGNDDVGMSMTAHGYGAALYSSAHIFFSNIIYGWFIKHLPTILDIYPYFYMTFIALFVVAFTLLSCFDALAIKKLISIPLIVIILIRAIAMPQFTVNAGLLAAASVIAILVYIATLRFKYALIGMLLIFYSFLIRDKELFFVYLVALPFLLNRNLFNRKFIIAFFILITSCIGAKYANFLAFNGEAYSHYKALSQTRVPFNDYHAGAYFIQRPEILKNYGYSENDISLLSNFIFADPLIADPSRLKQLLTHFKVTTRLHDNIPLAIETLKSINHPTLQLLIIISIFGTLLSRKKIKILISWSIFMAIIVFIALLGRPSVLRVYYPIISFLALVPFIFIDFKEFKYKQVISLVLIFLGIFVIRNNKNLNDQRAHIANMAVKEARQSLNQDLYYVFGASLPYEYIFLPLKPPHINTKFYAFGTAYYMPSRISHHYAFGSKSFSNLLKSGKILNVIAIPGHLNLIKNYCSEHMNKNLNIISSKNMTTFFIYAIQCT